MSKIVPGKIIRNMFHIYFMVAIIAVALSLGSVSGADGYIYRITGTTITKAATQLEVSTNAASVITATSATLNGNLTSLGTADSVNVSFEYGETTDYGKTTTAQKMTKTGTFTANLTGLTSGKTYHFRAMAAGDGTVTGDDATFTTTTSSKVTPPVVTTNAASGITATSATLTGNISDLGSGSSVLVSFEWGTTTAYGNTSQIRLLTKEGNFTAAPLTDLIVKTTYHFRAKAEGDGTVYGKDATFTTTPLPASFTFTTFNITPSTSQIGDTVNISVTCNNIGGSPGTYPVVLKINGVSEQTEEINLDPGKSQVVSFAITESKAGTYEVNVNELTSSFVVQESSQLLSISTPAQSATLEESGWPLVAGIAGGTILVGLIVLFIFRRSIA